MPQLAVYEAHVHTGKYTTHHHFIIVAADRFTPLVTADDRRRDSVGYGFLRRY